ncbi:hypothetical protein KC340_g34 [Hortaea werneckii]|nr:hypothetical protein KC340_g34 [Hortaea werneckii]
MWLPNFPILKERLLCIPLSLVVVLLYLIRRLQMLARLFILELYRLVRSMTIQARAQWRRDFDLRRDYFPLRILTSSICLIKRTESRLVRLGTNPLTPSISLVSTPASRSALALSIFSAAPPGRGLNAEAAPKTRTEIITCFLVDILLMGGRLICSFNSRLGRDCCRRLLLFLGGGCSCRGAAQWAGIRTKSPRHRHFVLLGFWGACFLEITWGTVTAPVFSNRALLQRSRPHVRRHLASVPTIKWWATLASFGGRRRGRLLSERLNLMFRRWRPFFHRIRGSRHRDLCQPERALGLLFENFDLSNSNVHWKKTRWLGYWSRCAPDCAPLPFSAGSACLSELDVSTEGRWLPLLGPPPGGPNLGPGGCGGAISFGASSLRSARRPGLIPEPANSPLLLLARSSLPIVGFRDGDSKAHGASPLPPVCLPIAPRRIWAVRIGLDRRKFL